MILVINVIWVKGEGVVFRKLLMRKCMDIPSVLFSFLEAAFKRRPRATEAVMSARFKTRLAVHGGDRTIVEKMIN